MQVHRSHLTSPSTSTIHSSIPSSGRTKEHQSLCDEVDGSLTSVGRVLRICATSWRKDTCEFADSRRVARCLWTFTDGSSSIFFLPRKIKPWVVSAFHYSSSCSKSKGRPRADFSRLAVSTGLLRRRTSSFSSQRKASRSQTPFRARQVQGSSRWIDCDLPGRIDGSRRFVSFLSSSFHSTINKLIDFSDL